MPFALPPGFPFVKFYQVILFVVAEPTAMFLNWWLGPESIALLRERDFHTLLLKHVEAGSTDVGRLEATGALNFLTSTISSRWKKGSLSTPAASSAFRL